ncbi:MAG: hypothetical protein JWO93_3289 [Micrococcaceae bacterium]|nr:hypothetical protein [Micrococcaceae bacterium]
MGSTVVLVGNQPAGIRMAAHAAPGSNCSGPATRQYPDTGHIMAPIDSTLDPSLFRIICASGALENIRLSKRPGGSAAPEVLLAEATVFDAVAGMLRLRFTGPLDQEPQQPGNELNNGIISINSHSASKLSELDAAVFGYGEFPELSDEPARQLAAEAIHVLSRVWAHADSELRESQEQGVPQTATLTRLNWIATAVSGTDPWRRSISAALDARRYLPLGVEDVTVDSAFPDDQLDRHPDTTVTVTTSALPHTGPITLAAVLTDSGTGQTTVRLKRPRLAAGPLPPLGLERGVVAFDRDGAGAVRQVHEWLVALSLTLSDYIEAKVGPIAARFRTVHPTGLLPADDLLDSRMEGALRAAVARMNVWTSGRN